MEFDWFRTRTAWHAHANERRYEAPADPWSFRWVSPSDIDCYNNEVQMHWGLGRVQGGNWDGDEHCHPIRETPVYRGFRQRFEGGHEWVETELYEKARDQFEEHGTYRGYDSLEEYWEVRCGYNDDLYRSVERDGYRPNADAGHEMADDDNDFEGAYANHLKPLVVIGREGDIYWTEGFHRFAVASLLGVEAIPVYVLCRHERWQAVRETVAATPRSELSPSLRERLDHPDLGDLV